jgi:isoleucyl-tRNA synthetase
MDQYDQTKAVRAIQEFVNEDLSNWYIRRSRRRFWATELTEDKKSVYNTTMEILIGVAQLVAPFSPYIAEEIYRNLTGELSVHLSDLPEVSKELVDENTERRMDLVRNLVTLGRAARETERIKVRQPLRKIHIDGEYESVMSDLTPLIMEELNIKEVVFEKNLQEFMNFSLKPNFRTAGPKLGKNVKSFAGVLAKANALDIINGVQNGKSIDVEVNGEIISVTEDMLDIRITSKEGFNVSMENNLFVILDTNLDDELINEGYAREFISKIQQMRKTNGYEMMDNIDIYFKGSEEIIKAVELYKEYILKETLAIKVELKESLDCEVQNLNGQDTCIEINKA